MTNGYYVNKFQGDVRPVRKSKSAPPIWQEEIRIGEVDTPNSHLWTTFRLYVRPATLQYPNAGLFLSFGNGEHFAFARLNQSDLEKIYSFLTEFKDTASEIHRDEIRKGIVIEEQRKQLDIIQHLSGDTEGQSTIQDLTAQVIAKLQSEGRQLPIGISNPYGIGVTANNLPPTEGELPINLNTSSESSSDYSEAVNIGIESTEEQPNIKKIPKAKKIKE